MAAHCPRLVQLRPFSTAPRVTADPKLDLSTQELSQHQKGSAVPEQMELGSGIRNQKSWNGLGWKSLKFPLTHPSPSMGQGAPGCPWTLPGVSQFPWAKETKLHIEIITLL